MSAAVSSPRLADDALLSASTSSLTASLHESVAAGTTDAMPHAEDDAQNVEVSPGDMDDSSSSSDAGTPRAHQSSRSSQHSVTDASGQDHDRQDDVQMEGTAEPEESHEHSSTNALTADGQPQADAAAENDNDNQAASDDEDDAAEDGDGSESEDDDYAYEHREFLEGYKTDNSVPGPEELDEMHRRRDTEVSALKEEHWKGQFFTSLDDPEHSAGDSCLLSWTFDGYHGTKEAPNKPRHRSSPPVTITNHDGKQYQITLKVFPRGHDGTEFMSVFIECQPCEPTPEPSPEDVDRIGPSWWEATAQFGCVMYNPVEPRVHRFQKSHHQFTSINSDFGWTRFAGPWMQLHQRDHLQYRPLIQDDKVAFAAYVRLVKDPTRALWYHNQFPHNPDWDPVLKTGYRGLTTTNIASVHSALVSALAIWYELAPFRKLVSAFELNKGLEDPLNNFQPMFDALKMCLNKKQRSRKQVSATQDTSLDQVVTVLEWYGYTHLTTVFEVWKTLEELIKHEVNLQLQRKPSAKANELEQLVNDFFETAAYVQCATRPTMPSCDDLETQEPARPTAIDYTSLRSTQELVTKAELADSPAVILVELPRQNYDPEKRKWKKLAHKIKLDDKITQDGHSYQIFAFVCHSGELGSGRFQPVIQPRGPGTPWLRWSTRNSSRGSVLMQTYRQAVTAHEGADHADASSTVACVVVYLREDVSRQLLILGPERELHDVYNPITEDVNTDAEITSREIIVAVHLSSSFPHHKSKAGFVDAWGPHDENVLLLSMQPDDTVYDMHEKLKMNPTLLNKQFCVWLVDMQRDIRQYCPVIQYLPLEAMVTSFKDDMNGTHFWVHVLDGEHAEASKRQYEEMARTKAAESLASLKQGVPAPVVITEQPAPVSSPDEPDDDVVMGGTEGDGSTTQQSANPPEESTQALPSVPPTAAAVPVESDGLDVADPGLDSDMAHDTAQHAADEMPVQLEEPIPPPPITLTYQEPQGHLYILVKHFYPLRKTSDKTVTIGHRLEPAVQASTSMLVPGDAIIKNVITRPQGDNFKAEGLRFYREVSGSLPVAVDGQSTFSAADIPHGSIIITEPVLTDMHIKTLTSQGFPVSLAEMYASVIRPGQNNFGTGWASCPIKFDRPHGKGVVIYPNGDAYSGNFVSGKRSGQGTMFYANGSNYQGDWRGNEPNGEGTMIHHPSGNKYVGPFKDGKQTGAGGVTHWKDASVNEKICRICYVDERNTVFVRCGHMVACQLCAQQVSDCPVCRRPIEQVVRVWDTLQ